VFSAGVCPSPLHLTRILLASFDVVRRCEPGLDCPLPKPQRGGLRIDPRASNTYFLFLGGAAIREPWTGIQTPPGRAAQKQKGNRGRVGL